MIELMRELTKDILAKQPLVTKVVDFVRVQDLQGNLYSIALEKYDEDDYKRLGTQETSFFVHFYCNDLANGDLGVKWLRKWFLDTYNKQKMQLGTVKILHMYRDSYAVPATFDRVANAYEDVIMFRIRWREE